MIQMEQSPPPALLLDKVDVAYRTRGRDMRVLSKVSIRIEPGEAYGLVGESGCGKSTVALTVLHTLPGNGHVLGGKLEVAGRDLRRLDAPALRHMRAHDISMVYQDAGRALNPSMTVGRQLLEVFEVLGQGGQEAVERAHAMLARVQISGPARVMASYPHQLSGGMQQRVVIAMALAKDPSLLILDEPTTGLDATVEAEVLDLVADLRRDFNSSILFISHNLGAIASICDRVGVLYAGHLVEEGPAQQVFSDPRHPYTASLLRCLPKAGLTKRKSALETIPGFLPPPGAIIKGCCFAPRCSMARQRCHDESPPAYDLGGRQSACHYHDHVDFIAGKDLRPVVVSAPAAARQPALALDAVSKTYHVGGQPLHAVRDVSMTLQPGQTLGLVGESGSGKTTLARLLLGLVAPDAGGRIELDGEALAPTAAERPTEHVKAMQIVFQNPDSALNRAHTVRHLIGRALSRLAGLRGRRLREEMMRLVGAVRLTERHLALRPRQLSGGLKQRVAIARAFAGNPRIVVCDEPTSALDVSVQAAILNLLAELQDQRQVSYVFISHDLGVVRYLADRIAVLYLGRLMELGPAEAVFTGPHHPYTEALLSAVPSHTGRRNERIKLKGEIPSPLNPPSGCVFQTRCPRKVGEICETTEPPMQSEDDHGIRCHIPRAELGRLTPAHP
ncbi:peptide/nickel transport system ATP-binding protein [Arboricoccus pini]|uniref:Peptide/nickel transport system ATP-binding protein n=2 Tax=Arboricoccus pini TaxID=1963835 RepID=A0A212RRZ9_9PROT|nr:peptide/nickel transport system ATP-binding protein [Arboricoccus pini]